MEGKGLTMSRGTRRLRTLDDVMRRLVKGRLRGGTKGVKDAHEEGRGMDGTFRERSRHQRQAPH